MDYFLHIFVLASIYSILAISLDILVGHTRLLSLAHAGFYGIGAYVSSILALEWGWPFLVTVPIGMVAAATISLAISLPSTRLHGDYFVIATFAFQIISFAIFNNWMAVTRGPLGVPGIPNPQIANWRVETNMEFAALAVVFAISAYIIIALVVKSPMGRVLHAIREDEVFAKSCGKCPVRFKVTVFAISSALAALAGGLYAHYMTFIDPTSFTIMESILVLSMVIIGGAGSMWGPLAGAVVLVSLPEALRFLGFSGAVAANLRQIVYGSLLVVMMMVRPRGIVGQFTFGRRFG